IFPKKQKKTLMDYFKILNLDKEPFSNSPDPAFFFQSRQHVVCLQKLEMSLRLRRGLNVVIGEVGTGKTTLCRQLIRLFADDETAETHLILDPFFSDPLKFLLTIAEMFEGPDIKADGPDYWHLKEIIKQYLFRRGVEENRTVILIIDEGQKLPDFCLEILRELLNYETNEYKLLQIAIFAQREFDEMLRERANFADRMDIYHALEPMSFRDTRQMIRFRIQQSCDAAVPPALFTYPGLWAIYRATRGYPRKIVSLCHRAILAMIIQNRSKVDWFIARSCAQRGFSSGAGRGKHDPAFKARRRSRFLAYVSIFLLWFTALAVTFGGIPDRLKLLVTRPLRSQHTKEQVTVRQDTEIAPSEKNEQKTQRKSTEHEDCPKTNDVWGDIRPASEIPKMLGQLTIKQGETLEELIHKVYGSSHMKYQEAVIAANAHIENPNRLSIGERVVFPAMPLESVQQDGWWLELGSADTLEAAMKSSGKIASELFRSFPDDPPGVRLLSYWNRQNGMKFALILEAYFSDEISARDRLNGLRTSPGLDGKILSFRGEGTVFLTEPYF
ncbi:MAG: hypothetical protein DRI57_20225, partial [Deltaproteobacteria bacterium]